MLDAPSVGASLPVASPAATVSPGAATRALVPLFATTLFLSSFLMFAVEPMAARRLLPVLGGVPMVWNGCVVFFQATLLLGYGCAHALTRWFPSPTRLLVYAALAVLPLPFLQLGVDPPAGGATAAPLSWLVAVLVQTVGPAFLTLAVSASVLQGALASSRHAAARDPYFLYAASNAGSLTALVAYPLVIEPWLGLAGQARAWQSGYAVFAVLVLGCAGVSRYALPTSRGPDAVEDAAGAGDAAPVTWARRARWSALAFIPSSLLLGVTTALTTDIAPVPLLWVLPLALYLLTFIVAFGRRNAPATALAGRVLPSLLLGVAAILLLRVSLSLPAGLVLHLLPFTAGAMLCHGLLAQSRPAARELTGFYFWLAFGGMAGGLFNTLAAPLLFSRVVEYPLALTWLALLRPGDPARGGRQAIDVWLPALAGALVAALLFVPAMTAHRFVAIGALAACAGLALSRRHRPVTFAVVAGAFLLASPWVTSSSEAVVETDRTFFGTYRVSEDRGAGHRSLAHGTTLHGMQRLEGVHRTEPLTYYHRTGPVGQLIDAVPRLRGDVRVAAVGLGVGTLAAYARPGQTWTFYEIDPAIERIARDRRYFTFLEHCGSACRVVIGDARLSLAADAGPRYHLIVLDAFSSDAIPIHLLTNEAMAVYLSRLAPGGVLAIHVSNRHLRLDGVVGRLAAANGLVALQARDRKGAGPWPALKVPSDWVALARAREDLGALTQSAAWIAPEVRASTPLWTDDFSNLLSVLQLRGR